MAILKAIMALDAHRMAYFFLPCLACAFVCICRFTVDRIIAFIGLGFWIRAFAIAFGQMAASTLSTDAISKQFTIDKLQKDKEELLESLKQQHSAVANLQAQIMTNEADLARSEQLLTQSNVKATELEELLKQKDLKLTEFICYFDKDVREREAEVKKHREANDRLERSNSTRTTMLEKNIANERQSLKVAKDKIIDLEKRVQSGLSAKESLVLYVALGTQTILGVGLLYLWAKHNNTPVVTPVAEKSGWGRLFKPA
ncbi:hypothetical protein HDK64DRAFT_323510 [Phyllosticta capitalensis]